MDPSDINDKYYSMSVIYWLITVLLDIKPYFPKKKKDIEPY